MLLSARKIFHDILYCHTPEVLFQIPEGWEFV